MRKGGWYMAIWQFYCNIISSTKNSDILSRDELISWKDIPLPGYNIDFLKCEKSWAKNIVQYGNIDETCIEFIFCKDKLDEILCKLDLRTLTKYMLDQIVEYVKNIEACFLVEDMIYPPEIKTMISVLMKSRANEFCRNPLGYIKSLK